MSIRARRAPFKLRKLLVIDDDLRLLASYRDLLSPYGFEVLTAPDGTDAIPLVEKNPDIQLVILDLAMPRMDGREWLRWFRLARKESPVIIARWPPDSMATQTWAAVWPGDAIAGRHAG